MTDTILIVLALDWNSFHLRPFRAFLKLFRDHELWRGKNTIEKLIENVADKKIDI